MLFYSVLTNNFTHVWTARACNCAKLVWKTN